jgi:hypothetical protein
MKARRFFTIALMIELCITGASFRAQAQELAKKDKNKPVTPAAATSVTGSGTPGRISKWSGVSGSTTYVLGDSSILEDKFGKIGIGTDTPTSKLTVQGLIETKGTEGGVKFPDGSVQTTAGVAPNDVVRSLNGLKGDLQVAAGSNITITPMGNTLTIASTIQDPARSAFQARISLHWDMGDFEESGQIAVPAGKRLVIEYITVRTVPGFNAAVNLLELTTTVNSVTVTHNIHSIMGGSTSGVSAEHKQVRIYADGGTNVVFFARRDTAPGSGDAALTISGYLVDIP